MKRKNIVFLWGILLLICMLVPAVMAAGPVWTVKASPGIDLNSVAISRDGSTIVAGGGQLIVISRDGSKLWSGWSGSAIDVSRDGNYIVTSQGTSVRLFNREGTKLWDAYLGSGVADVSITPDATIIAAGGGGTIQAWYNSGVGLGVNSSGTSIRHIQVSPARDQIIVTTAGALRSYNISCFQNWFNDTFSPDLVEMSGDGSLFVIPVGNHIRLYHGGSALLWDHTVPGGNIISVVISRDGSTIVFGSDDGSIGAVDANANLLWSAKPGSMITSVGISDNGSVIAAGGADRRLEIYNRQGELIGSDTLDNIITSRSVAVSGDGTLVAATQGSRVLGYVPFPGTPVNASLGIPPLPVQSAISPTEIISPLPTTQAAASSSTPPVDQIVVPPTTAASGFLPAAATGSVLIAYLIRRRYD